ncbi:hypothetical protein WJX77_003008 [Trebouxia sp. C0004]
MRFRVLGEFHKHRGIYLCMAGTNVLNIWASAAASQPSPATDSAASRLLGNGSSNDTAQPAILWEAFAARRRSVSRQLRVGDDIASSPFAPFPAGWDSNLSNTVTTWKQHCQTYFTQMRVCSCCGVTELGDEHSDLRWSEIKDLEEMLHRFNESYTYGDAPVECAALFMRRLDDFMKLHIVGKQGGLLGTVKHYVIRFEGKRYSKSTFPLMLAYTLTVHKSQGATLDFAIVDLSDCFCPGLSYVAISRVRHRGCLRLMHRPTPEHAYLVPLPSIVTQGALHAAMPHPPSTDIEFGQSELPDSDMASPDQLLASLARDLRRNPPPPAPGRTFKFSPKQLKALRMGRATPEEMAACRSQDDTSRLFDTLDLRRRHFKAAHDGEDRANGTQIMLLTKWGELYDEEDMTYKEANRIMTGHLPGIRWFEVTTLMEDHGVSIDTIYSLKDLTRDQGEALVKRFTDRKRTASQVFLRPLPCMGSIRQPTRPGLLGN